MNCTRRVYIADIHYSRVSQPAAQGLYAAHEGAKEPKQNRPNIPLLNIRSGASGWFKLESAALQDYIVACLTARLQERLDIEDDHSVKEF